MAVEMMVRIYGLARVGVLTLTFGVPGSGKGSYETWELRQKAKHWDFVQNRWRSFRTNVVAVRYADWICVFEMHRDRVWHIHVVVVTKEDIRTGTDIETLSNYKLPFWMRRGKHLRNEALAAEWSAEADRPDRPLRDRGPRSNDTCAPGEPAAERAAALLRPRPIPISRSLPSRRSPSRPNASLAHAFHCLCEWPRDRWCSSSAPCGWCSCCSSWAAKQALRRPWNPALLFRRFRRRRMGRRRRSGSFADRRSRLPAARQKSGRRGTQERRPPTRWEAESAARTEARQSPRSPRN